MLDSILGAACVVFQTTGFQSNSHRPRVVGSEVLAELCHLAGAQQCLKRLSHVREVDLVSERALMRLDESHTLRSSCVTGEAKFLLWTGSV